MLEKYEVVQAFFHGFDYKPFFNEKANKLSIMIDAQEHVLKQDKGKERYLEQSGLLLKAFALSLPNQKALKIRNDVGFFQAVRAAIVKNTGDKPSTHPDDVDFAIRQILSKAVISDRVIDIFAAAGLDKPNISVLSDDFLAYVKEMPQKNLAFEALKKLLQDEIKN